MVWGRGRTLGLQPWHLHSFRDLGKVPSLPQVLQSSEFLAASGTCLDIKGSKCLIENPGRPGPTHDCIQVKTMPQESPFTSWTHSPAGPP